MSLVQDVSRFQNRRESNQKGAQAGMSRISEKIRFEKSWPHALGLQREVDELEI
jgi:hypothetical protein